MPGDQVIVSMNRPHHMVAEQMLDTAWLDVDYHRHKKRLLVMLYPLFGCLFAVCDTASFKSPWNLLIASKSRKAAQL